MRSRLIINGSELGLGWGTKVKDFRIGLDDMFGGSCLLDAVSQKPTYSRQRKGRARKGQKWTKIRSFDSRGKIVAELCRGSCVIPTEHVSRNPCNRDNGV